MGQSGFLKKEKIFSKHKTELEKPNISFNTKNEFMDWMNKRMDTLERYGVSNCIGTALYVAGELNEDKYMYGKESEEILYNLKEKSSPHQGVLVAWCSEEEIYHLGIVTNTDPFLIFNREGANGHLKINQPFEKVCEEYSFVHGLLKRYKLKKIKYFVPSKLENIL